MIKNNMHNVIILMTILSGCYSPDVQDNNSHKNTNNFKCNYTYDSDSVKNGEYRCIYSDGEIRERGVLKDDSVKIFERLLFFRNGQMEEYSFYNPIGELRYRCTYDSVGSLIDESGSYLSHDELSDPQISVGDSTTLTIYVANPPGSTFKIYGIDSEGKYEMNVEETDKPYAKSKIIYGKSSGTYVLPYEVEFIDSVRNRSEIIKSEVTLTVEG